ncbi:hypothetical protein RSAG8_04142, partial [Rhizoctonia solani AG-8 WAC10335]
MVYFLSVATGFAAGGRLGAGVLTIKTTIVSWLGRIVYQNLERPNPYLDDAARERAGEGFAALTWSSALLSGVVLVAGNDEKPDARCWEQVLGPDHLKKMDDSKRAIHGEHGMLLQDVASYCKAYKDEKEEVLILCNDREEYFAFTITETVKAGTSKEYPNSQYDVTVVHAFPVQLSK